MRTWARLGQAILLLALIAAYAVVLTRGGVIDWALR